MRRVALLAPCLLVAACVASDGVLRNGGEAGAPGDTASPGATDSAAPGRATVSGVSWHLESALDDVVGLDGGGWLATRADGAELVVTRGWVVVSALVLEPCEAAERRRTPAPPHGLPDHPSAMTDAVAVPLHRAWSHASGARAFEVTTVCDVGIGLSRADGATRGLPTDLDLNGLSLALDGRVRQSPIDPWTDLTVRTTLPSEADAPLPGEAPSARPHLTLSLHPGRLLDGVDLADHPDRVALALLDSLSRTATASFGAPPPPAPPPDLP